MTEVLEILEELPMKKIIKTAIICNILITILGFIVLIKI